MGGLNGKTLGLLLLMAAQVAEAATAGLTLLPTAATDKKTYDAKLAIGLTVDGGKSWQASANLNQSVLIKASVDPVAAHVGTKADIFVVELYNNQWKMLTANGVWVPWSTKMSDLQPMRDDLTLAATQELTIHSGSISTAGDHKMFIGYLPVTSGAPLIYTGSAASFQFNAAATDPQTYFTDQIFSDIVMAKCTLCHTATGVASISDLHFVKDAAKAQENFQIFKSFYGLQPDAFNYVLAKASGGNGHVGGIQLPLGSAEYQKMAAFLGLLDGATTVATGNVQGLMDGVANESSAETLRDAALLLAGRPPTSAESSAVTSGGETGLRTTVLNLMQGEHFHNFLKDAANDRLFLRGNEEFNIADDCPVCFPALNAEYFRLKDKADASRSAADRTALNTWMQQLNYSVVESPLELIAYVVENNRPYSEILTADYDMMTPLFNTATGGTAVFPAGASPVSFQPGRITTYYLRDSATQLTPVPGAAMPRVTNPGNTKVSYPHVGVLSSKSFLSRYPSTATNRNRARARWTWYNFLGVDIEALAKRSTDPVALADTNNPTMNNPACTVCHSVLDPVAGTFQDYGDNGTYKTSLNGTDSLDRLYKITQNGVPSLYKTGDTWYRDMRTPGFDGATATGTNTTRWLADQIVKDKRFATSTVRFWWPAVIGAELLKAPEVTTDSDYAARLAAYEAQQAELAALSDKFVQSGLSLKQLLADLVMSRWYRAGSRGSTSAGGVLSAARDLATLTGEKLLTPEQLSRKTRALTGFNWNAQMDTITATLLSGLENDYNTFYGGIDSFALKVRAREITPLMSNVSSAHALESSCPIVLGDFIRTDAERLLFGGLSPWMTPLTQAAMTQSMSASTGASDFKPSTLTVALQPGANKVVLSVLNDACDYATSATTCRASKNLLVSTVAIRAPNGATTTLGGSSGTYGACAAPAGSNLTLYSSCTVEYPFNADSAGTYTITANLAATQSTTDPVLAGINVEANVAAATATTPGASALKSKLVELHGKLLGQTVTATSPEVLASYDLLVQTWQGRKAGNAVPSLLQGTYSCDWSTDLGFISTLPYPGSPFGTNGRYNTGAVTTWLAPQAQDPLYMKQSWATVMTYLLTHYDYLHN